MLSVIVYQHAVTLAITIFHCETQMSYAVGAIWFCSLCAISEECAASSHTAASMRKCLIGEFGIHLLCLASRSITRLISLVRYPFQQ